MLFSRRMFHSLGICVALLAGMASAAMVEHVHGTIGKDQRWSSGWIDTAPLSLSQGDQLLISVGGTANKVVVRLLDDTRRADSPEGVIGVFIVGKDRIVRVPIETERKGVQQISVHGGPNPWNLYDLGGGNGPATISDVQIVRAQKK